MTSLPLAKIFRLSRLYGLASSDAAYFKRALRLQLPLRARDAALVQAVPKADLALE